jgi:oxygen-independent coproporphyrinogen-3 oxidase
MSPITESLLKRFDIPGPRYTSYPTADRFTHAFGESQYRRALEARTLREGSPLSVYVHVPFCAQLCYYCACNKIITRHRERGTDYLQWLAKEIELHTAILGSDEPVTQLHLGGGSPTFLDDADLEKLMLMLRGAFRFVAGGEYSIEVDPRTVDASRLRHLASLGFNRLSFGVQDFDAQVQQAVHRVQSEAMVFELVAAARELGFESVNTDFIYGLPMQTEASFARTLEKIAALRPDRIALYAYAHLPERFKPQRRIDAYTLPAAGDKIGMLRAAHRALEREGYVYIGMDHFALPDDALAVAKAQGRLHRNFQGYSTQPDCDLIALGVSSIGRIGNTYSQNVKTLESYTAHLSQGRFATDRGIALSAEDLLRRDVIMQIMCRGELSFDAVEAAHRIDFAQHFAAELESLRHLRDAGLCELAPRALKVTPIGWYFVRVVAMSFDAYLHRVPTTARYSKVI